MLKKIILSLCIFFMKYNLVFSQISDYPTSKNIKKAMSSSKCNRVYLPIIDTNIILCNREKDTLIGTTNINGKAIDYKVFFVGNIGTSLIILTANDNTKSVFYKVKGSSRLFRYEKQLVCDVYGNCKSIKVKVYRPLVSHLVSK